MERTLSIVKPDGVAKNLIGEVISRFEGNNLKVVALKMCRLNRPQAEGFYAVHKEKPFFGSLVEIMTSGPVVIMVLEGENAITRNRKLMGATDPAKADEGTIRRQFADSVEQNIVHGSDAPDTANNEINYFFNALELWDH